jgi:hypothetical protein
VEAVDLKRPLNLFVINRWRLLVLGLLLLALFFTAMGVIRTLSAFVDLELVLFLLVFGSIFSWGLASSQISARLGWVVISIGGFFLVCMWVGNLEGILLELLRQAPFFAREVVQWGSMDTSSFATYLSTLLQLGNDLGVLMGRLWDWSSVLLSQRRSFDPIAAALAWGWIFWLISVWAGWFLRREHAPFIALLPAGALLSGSLSYATAEYHWLLLFLGCVLFLKASIGLMTRLLFWADAGVDYHTDLGGDALVASLIITVILVALAWFTSSFHISEIIERFQKRVQTSSGFSEDFAESVGMQPGSGSSRDVFKEVDSPGLPREHLIGAGPELSEQIVMEILLENLSIVENDSGFPLLYWRGLTYDTYTGRGWQSSRIAPALYEAGEEIPSLDSITHQSLRQHVRMVKDQGGLLYAVGEPISVDQEFTVAWRTDADLFGVIVEGEEYRVDSSIAVVTEEMLRSAGQDYPQWLLLRYLSLPEDVPARVRSLALDLTATERTPYDRALAIERYLRKFPYTLDVPKPPFGRDVADFMLFDLKKGYCDYYATAMVVLARAAGLPSRLAVGYAGGIYNEGRGTYFISEAQAHSWVEIYLMGVGWMPFEPTAGRPAIDRDFAPSMEALREVGEPLVSSPLRITGNWGWGVMGIILCTLATISLFLILDSVRLRQRSSKETLALLYRRLRAFSAPLPVVFHRGDTPFEYYESMAKYLNFLAQRSFWGSWLKNMIRDMQELIQLVVSEQFGPRSGGRQVQIHAMRLWRRLRLRLLLARAWSFAVALEKN